jgi:hypothetical protein
MSYLLQTRNRGSRVLLDHWEALRREGAVPLQTQIRPRALKEILPQVFIVEAADPRCPIYRLAGTGLCERFGRELRGVPFLADWEIQSQRSVVSIMRTAQTRLLPACFHTVASLEDFGWVDVETVLAPLARSDSGAVRFLGTMQITSDLPRLNRGIIVSQRLVTSQMALADETQQSPARDMRQAVCRPLQPHWLKVVLTADRPGMA